MVDFVLGIGLAALLVRGWIRGAVREALDLVGLVAGIWIAFKLSGPLGEFLVERFGAVPEVASVGAGIALFLLFGAAMSIAAHYLTKVMTLPGLGMINRFGGAAVAISWGVAVVLVVVNVMRVFPLPERWVETLDDSVVVESIAGEEAVPQAVFLKLAPDNVLASLQSLQSVFGSTRLVPEGDEVIDIPPARPDEVRQTRDAASEVVEWLNEYRAGLGIRPLDPSDAITAVAEERAVSMYTTGRLSRDNPPGRRLAGDLAAAGLRLEASGENLALASSARAAWDGMLESNTALSIFGVPTFDRVGVAVVDGPTGRLVVVDLAG